MNLLFSASGKWIRVAVFGLLFMLIPQTIDFWSVKFSSPEDYFVYSKTEVKKGSVEAGTDVIRVFSHAEIKRRVTLRFQDVLWCSTNGGSFEFTDSNETTSLSEAQKLPKTEINEQGEEIEIPWRFTVNSNLQKEDVCRIESKITAVLPYGVEHTQHVTSNTFVIQ